MSGIKAALKYEPTKCGERFNLGFGDPVSVPEMIEILQEELEVRGKVVSVFYLFMINVKTLLKS